MKSFLEWFKASTKVKRWIFLIVLGIALTCYGFTQILVKDVAKPEEVGKIVAEFVVRICIYNNWNYIYSKKKFRNINRSK